MQPLTFAGWVFPTSLSWTDWNFEPTVCTALLAAVVAYVAAWRRGVLRSSDDVVQWLPASAWRPWLFGVGIATAYIALQSPIDKGGDDFLLSIHMVQHLLLMMVAPPFLLLGIAGARPMAPRRARRTRRVWWAITRVWPACLLFNAVLLVWHLPVLYNTTLTVGPLHVFEHITFFAVGVIFWWPIVDPFSHAGTRRVSPLTKVAMLTIAGVPPTVVGLLFAVAPAPFYSFYVLSPRLWGWSAITDQQVAGVIMFGLGNLVYFVAVGIIFWRLMGESASEEAEAAAA